MTCPECNRPLPECPCDTRLRILTGQNTTHAERLRRRRGDTDNLIELMPPPAWKKD